MKKFKCLILVVCFAIIFGGNIFATEAELEYVDDTEDYGSYEDYYNQMMSGGYSQEQLETLYPDYLEALKKAYDDIEVEILNSARVISAGDVKTEYYYDSDYNSITKINYQEINVEVMDGDYIGEEISLDYYLTGDMLGNIELAPVKIGDVVFVQVSEDDTRYSSVNYV